MLLAPGLRSRPLRQPLGDSVSEIDLGHSLQGLKLNTSDAECAADSEPHKAGRLPPSCQPAKPASVKFWREHLKAAAPHGRPLAISYDKV
jgi:hypothetical protein